VLALSVLARYVFLEASARYVLATGETLIEGYRHFGRGTLWLILVCVVIKRHGSNLYQLLLLGLTMSWILPLPFEHGAAVWSLFFWSGGFALMYWGRYRTVERWSRPLVVLLGAVLACAAVLARPDPAAIARGFLVPSLGNSDSTVSAAFVLMALVGSAAGAMSNLKYPAFLHEKGWRDASRLQVQRADLATSAIGLLIMGAMVQAAAAGALPQQTSAVSDPLDMVSAFGASLGPLGSIMVALGLWGAVFTTFLASNTGYSLITADIVGNLSKHRQTASAGERPAYRWALLWFLISPLYALWTDWSPVWIVLSVSALETLVMPITALLLLLLTANRKRMGRLSNTLATNVALVLVIFIAAALVARNVWEWL
jgi:Mn2+/Fe2+ NRAMP family transporter